MRVLLWRLKESLLELKLIFSVFRQFERSRSDLVRGSPSPFNSAPPPLTERTLSFSPPPFERTRTLLNMFLTPQPSRTNTARSLTADNAGDEGPKGQPEEKQGNDDHPYRADHDAALCFYTYVSFHDAPLSTKLVRGSGSAANHQGLVKPLETN